MLRRMSEPGAPDDIVRLAEQRAAARGARDWETADRLRAEIEAAGWRIVDTGTDFDLNPATPPDIVDGERVLYGAASNVPFSDTERTRPGACVVIATDPWADADTSVESILATSPEGTQVVVIAGAGGAEHPGSDAFETVRTAVPFGPGAALEAGIRRAERAVVVAMQPGGIASDDVVSPLLVALDDEAVAIVGAEGLRSSDLRRYQPAPTGQVTAVGPACFAFRRADAIERGPVDERLNLPGSVAAWLSLVLRDEGEDAQPRRAICLDLPLDAAPARPADADEDRARLARRDAYRIADRFAVRRWLASEEPPGRRLVGDGPDDAA